MAKAAKHQEVNNAMDYSEHERTFSGFIWFTKWSAVFLAALMLAMAFGFFGGGGLVGGTLALIVICVAAWFLL